MRSFPSGWNSILAKFGIKKRRERRRGSRNILARHLRMESLEDRQMLSTTWTVTWDHDELDPNDGQLSLREAIVTCLDAIRHSSDAVECVARNGYYEHKLKLKTDVQLIRVFIDKSEDSYPTISASKHRLNIRFMQWSPGELNSPQTGKNIDFQLMLCGI